MEITFTGANVNGLTKALMPVVEDFVNDLLSEKIDNYLDEAFTLVEKTIRDSETKLDDMLLLPLVSAARVTTSKFISSARILKSVFMDSILEIVESKMERYGTELFDLLEKYIRDTGTKIDDRVFLPVLKTIRAITFV